MSKAMGSPSTTSATSDTQSLPAAGLLPDMLNRRPCGAGEVVSGMAGLSNVSSSDSSRVAVWVKTAEKGAIVLPSHEFKVTKLRAAGSYE